MLIMCIASSATVAFCIFATVENQSFSRHERDMQERSAGEESKSHAENVYKRVQHISEVVVLPG